MDKDIQVDNRKEVFEAVLVKIDKFRKNIVNFDRNDQDGAYNQLLEILKFIKQTVKNAEDAIVLIYHFMQLDEVCCENIDTDGFLEMAFLNDATELFIQYAKNYPEKDKLAEIVDNLILNDDYGCRAGISKSKEQILQ